jgi:GH24 family phage-related lysozyme (muramidase)
MNIFLKVLLIFCLTTSLFGKEECIDAENLSLDVSKESIEMIIFFEISSRSYYERNFAKPMVPAWQTTVSGVTIGIGFDAGHNTKEQIRKATEGILNEKEIEALQSVSGLKGKAAYYTGLPKVRNNVYVTYEQAEQIFYRDSLPRFTKQTATAFNLTQNRLHPHSNGALTSLVYNRGSSLSSSDSRKEMRWIKSNVSINREDRVPSDIKSMKRLWSYTKLRGLHTRRDAESAMFQRGLDARKK